MPKDNAGGGVSGDQIARRIVPVEISTEMRDSYMTYAMSVIFSRALPDARDGLKPVQRRIIYTMGEMNLSPGGRHVKCAKVAGQVSGSYHPHGNEVIYPALVRLGQDFSMRYLMVDPQGNFGSMDGDPPAAMRYTECRQAPAAVDMLLDIDRETVEFTPTYDEEGKEPSVLPGKFPNLLCNGGTGIAVGMATNIPTHNVTEVCNGIAALIDNPDLTDEELMRYVPGPDFPSAGLILGRKGIRDAYTTGKGTVTMQARASVEPLGGNKDAIIITELPYQVNKAALVTHMAELVRDKQIDGISDIRDESDRKGMRVVVELKRDANANVVLNQLYKHTAMRTNFACNMLALVDGVPRMLTLKWSLEIYIDHRREVILSRTRFLLAKAEERAHILEGFLKALSMLDAIIEAIRNSPSPAAARDRLQEAPFEFSERQAQAILDLTLSRLTQLERQKIQEEYEAVIKEIAYLREILENPRRVFELIKDDLEDIKKRHGDARRTEIKAVEADDIDIADLIKEEDMVVTMTRDGYIKRLPVATYRVQNRGGKGVIGLNKKEEDDVSNLFIASTHSILLFFTDAGRIYRLRAFEVPLAKREARGTAVVNLIPIERGEKVTATVSVDSFDQGGYLIMVTRHGVVKKTELKEYDTTLKARGIIAMNIQEGDSLRWVLWTGGEDEIFLCTRDGQSIRFHEGDVRAMGRNAGGVRGIKLRKDDEVVGCTVVDPDKDLLIVTENGFGKRTPLSEYRSQTRGGVGIKTVNVTQKNGAVVGCEVVEDDDQLMLLTSTGQLIRIPTANIRVTGRSAQGVILVRCDEGACVVGVEKVVRECEERERQMAEMDEMDSDADEDE
ncbi:MAG: DNA gyrase subunit A [Acidobacteriota bacterium]|jgi:DNA gyrase subunit A|nr:DNA gyrase subunit A [Acidobacteriota bacterium]NLN89704.1 DNA gyrase subunit A [candidate division WS1 bacterium]